MVFCQYCGGEAVNMGTLGQQHWFRCRACGMDFNVERTGDESPCVACDKEGFDTSCDESCDLFREWLSRQELADEVRAAESAAGWDPNP